MIKYRVWDKRKNIFIYDAQKGDENNSFDDFLHYDCYIVQAFTGVLDKNGREIYEGDIIFWIKEIEVFNELTRHIDTNSWVVYGQIMKDEPSNNLFILTKKLWNLCEENIFKIKESRYCGNIIENEEFRKKL